MLVKKYSNRRLYDTEESRYITLDELTDKVRKGGDVTIVDAKSGDDLTQATLTQIILETPAARSLPVPLLRQLIRMNDDNLGEFFGKYISAALEMYLAAKAGAQTVAPYFPMATWPFSAGGAVARMFSGWGGGPPPGAMPMGMPPSAPNGHVPPSPPPPAPDHTADGASAEASKKDETANQVAALREELAELRREIRKKKR